MSKEKSCLVTQNLVGTVKWALEAPNVIIKSNHNGDGKETWKERAMLDLKALICREKRPFPIAAQRGVAFEKKLYEEAIKSAQPNYSERGSVMFQKMISHVQGFKFYQKKGINETIDGLNCYLYGKFDAVRDNHIIDIKTTESYNKGKYIKGFQHLLYCYITKIHTFEYIIAEWEEYPIIKDIHHEHYTVESMDLLRDKIHQEITFCFNTLEDLGLWNDYRTKYCLY